MRTVRQLLESKPVEIHAVPPDAPVIEAIRSMAEHHVGALLVMEGTRRALADGVEITGQHDGKLFVLTVSSGTCSDGMSDNTYSLVSAFRHGDIDYKGCGEAAK